MSSNSWEPYKALMHVDKLHDYLREHRMRSLIHRVGMMEESRGEEAQNEVIERLPWKRRTRLSAL
jgi:hypothetical protein